VIAECQERLKIDWSFGSYNCPPCSLTYTNPFDLYIHTNLVHTARPTKRIYACKVCETTKKHYIKYQFDQIHTFFNHTIDERHGENIQFSCFLCSKVFWNLLALVNHYKQVHPAFNCVPCNHCGKIFQNCSFAARHLNLEVADDDEKIVREVKSQTLVCEACGKECKTKGVLGRHRKMIHKIVEPEDMETCTICNKV
jgi:hypothetical protein